MTAFTAGFPATCHRSLLTVSTAAIIASLATPGWADEAPTPTAPAAEEDAIVVTGQRTAELRALQIKERSIQVEETLVADDVGKLPDQNVAEAVKRLPGLSVANDQGEGRYVIIRGVNPNLVNVTVNGQTQPSPEPEGRQVKLDDLPSAMIQSVTVTKSLTPDQDANAIGGSVNINTLSAFDRTQDFFFAGRGEVGRYDMNGKHPWSIDGQVGGKFGANHEFGIVISGNYSKRPIESENFQGGGAFDASGRPDQYGLRDYNLERERTGIVVNLDYHASDAVKLYLRGTYSKFTDHEFRDQNRVDSLAYSSTTSGTFTGRPSVLIRLRNEDDNTKSISGGGTFKTGNGGQLDISGAYASAIKNDPLRSEFNFRGNTTSRTTSAGAVNPTGRNITGTFDLSTSPYLFSAPFATDYALNSVNYDKRHAQEDLWQVRADYSMPVNFGDDSTIKVGVKYLNRHKVNDRNILAYTGSAGFTLAGSGAAYTGDTNFYDGMYTFGPRIDYDKAQAFAVANPGLLGTNVSSTVGNSLANDYDVHEKIWAGYIMGTFTWGQFTLVPGVRVEHTHDDTAAKQFKIGSTLANSSSTTQAFNVFGKKEYTNVTPGVNLKFEPSDHLIIRAAVTTSIGRPNYADLAPFVSVDTTASPNAVLLGNPALKPYKAWNLDGSIEYYLPNKGVISVGAFYKHLDDPIYGVNTTAGANAFPGQSTATASVTQPTNANQAEIYGVEFNLIYQFDFLPAPLDGFGVSANLTLIDGHGEGLSTRAGQFPLFFQSKTVGNAQLTYEKYGITARLAYAYRSKYLDALGADTVVGGAITVPGSARDQYTDTNGQLDARIGYEVIPGAEIYVEGTNLTDAPWRRFMGVKTQLLERERYDASYRVGLQLKF
ncbi:MAG: TonB-dependent receptor [Sphingomonadales bacterium]|nr:TonB-dependent receptor [Sphingomonadales bacterium]